MSYLILNVNARIGEYCTFSHTLLLEQEIFEDRSECIHVRDTKRFAVHLLHTNKYIRRICLNIYYS